MAVTTGDGSTSTVAITGVPEHPFITGVTVKVTVMAALVVLFNVPEILPVPDAGIPVTSMLLSLVQLYVAPAVLPVNDIIVNGKPEQIVWLLGAAKASATGLTNMVAVMGVPWHPSAVGVMVNVTVTGVFPLFTSDPLILPDPLLLMVPAIPGLFLTQLNVVPGVVLDKTTWVMSIPLQTDWLAGVATATGEGFTNTVAIAAVPGQPFATGVTLNVTVTGNGELLINVPLILPDPLLAMVPVTAGLSLTQL